MFRSDLTGQPQLFAFSVRDLLPEDSDVCLYVDLFDRLELGDFYADYVSQGQPGIDPKLMIRTVFYGLAHGVVSGRKLADVCRGDVRYIVLSGEQRPDFRTFHRFVERHHARLEGLFVQVVRLAQKMGLVTLGRIAIDGSRVKGNTSRHKAMSYGRMAEAVLKIKEDLATLRTQLASENASSVSKCDDSLPSEITRRESRLAKIEAAKRALEEEAGAAEVVNPKAQKSFNDLEAMPMAKVGHEFKYGYNVQAAVDEASQIIVAAEIHDNPQDSRALPILLDKVEENCGQNAAEVLADSGYQSGSNLSAIDEKGSVPYIAAACAEKLTAPTVAEQVTATSKPHEYLCRAGKQLPVRSRRTDGTTEVTLPSGFCNDCPFQDWCVLFKKRTSKTINIMEEAQRQLFVSNLERLRSVEGRAVYRRRKAIVEPVFGNIKSNKGMRIFVKGRRKVGLWWKMAATAHNIEKIVKMAA